MDPMNLQAVILYHLHDYESALSVLDPLFQNIEPIDEVILIIPELDCKKIVSN
jgi:hypothetical protein